MNQFATTRWSVVVSAQAGSSTESDAALATLCQTYWFPVYAFVRRQGHDPESAKDLTQEFFAQLLEKQYLDSADRERGRFRTFLLTILQRFLTKQRDRERALKRGGDRRQLSLDWAHGERRLQYEPASTWTPEKIFERQWALALLDQVVASLRQEYAAKDKLKMFDACKQSLTGADLDYPALSQSLAMSEGALRVTVHRMRERYRELLRDHVAQTLDDPSGVDDELLHLRAAIRGE